MTTTAPAGSLISISCNHSFRNKLNSVTWERAGLIRNLLEW